MEKSATMSALSLINFFMKSSRAIFIAAALFSSATAFAGTTPFSVQYITPSSANNGYSVHMANSGNDSSALSISVNWEKKNAQVGVSNDILGIPDFFKSSAEISVTKTSKVYNNDTETSSSVDETSTIIKVRRADKALFQQKVSTNNISGNIHSNFPNLLKGTFFAFRLAWLIPVWALIQSAIRKEYKITTALVLMLLVPFFQLFIAYDITRLLCLCFPAVLVGFDYLFKEKPRQTVIVCIIIIVVNLILPVCIVGKDGVLRIVWKMVK